MSAAAGIGGRAPEPEVVFHDAECGGYTADLALWRRLADACSGPILDLGAGSGRVALPLARAGHRVIAVERDTVLAIELGRRAAAAGVEIGIVEADARELPALSEPIALALAPMQFMQLLDRADRRAVLARVAAALASGGLFAAALLDESVPLSSGEPDPLPDLREVEGWVHSSLPLDVRVDGGTIEILRLRSVVSPAGELSERRHEIRLHRLGVAELAAEAERCGLRAIDTEPIGQTEDHVASVAVLMERTDG